MFEWISVCQGVNIESTFKVFVDQKAKESKENYDFQLVLHRFPKVLRPTTAHGAL